MCVLLFMQRTCCWCLTCVNLSLQSTLAMTRCWDALSQAESGWVALQHLLGQSPPFSPHCVTLRYHGGFIAWYSNFKREQMGKWWLIQINSVDLENMMIKYIKRVQGYPSFRLTHFGPTMTKWSFLSPGFFGMLDFLPFQNVLKILPTGLWLYHLYQSSRNLENNSSKTWTCQKKKSR